MRTIMVLSMLVVVVSSLAQSPATDLMTTDWKVKVVLKNGIAIRGVVQKGRLAERLVDGVFQETSNANALGVGVRIWYVKGNDGFVFVPYSKVAKGVRIAPLTVEEKKTLQNLSRRRAEERQQPRQVTPKKDQIAKEKQPQTESQRKQTLSPEKRRQLLEIAKVRALEKLPDGFRALLQRYPPEEGWSRTRYEKYKPRIARNKQKGNPFDNISKHLVHFDYNFPAWEEAFSAFQQEQQEIFATLVIEQLSQQESEPK